MASDESRQKPYLLSFEGLPVSITVAPEQLQSVGEIDGVVTVWLRNGCRIDIGPLASREAAQQLVGRIVSTSTRARDLRPTPTTKEAYLKALSTGPMYFPYVGSEMGGPPADWVADAWELPSVQDVCFDGGIRRDYLKGLGLCCSQEFLAILANSLRTEQVVQLYERIREAQPERELEFRDDFLATFAAHAHALPPAGERIRRVPGRPGRPGRQSSGTWFAYDSEDEIPF